MVPMPAVVVLVLCRVISAGPEDQNASFTKAQNLQWDLTDAKMHCRRQEVQLYDASVDQGADPKPFTQMDCWRAGILIGSQWDASHPNSKYRLWRVACPVPLKNTMGTEDTRDDQIVGWSMPDCGHREFVVCDMDTAI